VAELNRQVDQSSDDCYRRLQASTFSTVGGTGYCGDYSGSGYDYNSGMRFKNITIPQGATILNAYLSLRASTKYGVIPQTKIDGQDADDAATFSTAGDYDARPRTSAYVLWTPSAWAAGNWYDSPQHKNHHPGDRQ